MDTLPRSYRYALRMVALLIAALGAWLTSVLTGVPFQPFFGLMLLGVVFWELVIIPPLFRAIEEEFRRR